MQLQIIRRRVDEETFEDVASGIRAFEVCLPGEDIREQDHFVFTNGDREVYRKVSTVVEANDLVIAGLVSVDFAALETVLAHRGCIVAYVVEKRDGKTEVTVPPVSMPFLVAPSVNVGQVNDFLRVERWPDGQFSILLNCQLDSAEDGRHDVAVRETIVMCSTTRDGVEMAVEADLHLLYAGVARDHAGTPIEPHYVSLEEDNGPALSPQDQAAVDRIVATDDSN